MNITKRYRDGRLIEHLIEGVAQPVGLGDKIAEIATPIARALKLPCIDKNTGKLKPDSGCQKRIDYLNGL